MTRNLRTRLLRALALGPLTVDKLAKMLWCTEYHVRHLLADLHAQQKVRIAGYVRNGKGRAWWLWRLV